MIEFLEPDEIRAVEAAEQRQATRRQKISDGLRDAVATREKTKLRDAILRAGYLNLNVQEAEQALAEEEQ